MNKYSVNPLVYGFDQDFGRMNDLASATNYRHYVNSGFQNASHFQSDMINFKRSGFQSADEMKRVVRNSFDNGRSTWGENMNDGGWIKKQVHRPTGAVSHVMNDHK